MDDLTIGEIGRTLVRLEAGQTAIRDSLAVLPARFVTRGEWEVRKEQLDQGLDQINARRVPWTAVGSLIVGASGLGLSLIVALTV